MCMFCNNDAKPIISNVDQSGIMNEKVQIFEAKIKDNELLFEIVFNHLSQNFDLSTLKKQISYCPMCGRKLVE